MHLWQDLVYTEVCDPETHRPVPYGSEGTPVYTHLERTSQPMIRLVSGDRTRWTDEPCPCGRTYPRLPAGIYGRFDDMLVVRGENVYPSGIEDALRAIPGFGGEFRVIVSRREAMDELLVRAEYTPEHEPPSGATRCTRTMRERLRARIGIHPVIELVPQGTLPRSEFKARRVVDDRDLYRRALADERAARDDTPSPRRARAGVFTPAGLRCPRRRAAPCPPDEARLRLLRRDAHDPVIFTRAPSPLGSLLLVGTGDALTAIWLPSGRDRVEPDPDWIESGAVRRRRVRQLDAYFAGRLRQFDLPLAPRARRSSSGCGGRCSTSPTARRCPTGSSPAGSAGPSAVRAVGAANGQNPAGDRDPVPPGHREQRSAGRATAAGSRPSPRCSRSSSGSAGRSRRARPGPRQGALFG